MTSFAFRSVALSLGLLAPAVAAKAADLPSRAPLPVLATPVANWSGFYAGALFGGGQTTFRASQVSTRTTRAYGQTGGGLIGYNWQNGSFVYGLEGDVTLHLIRKEATAIPGLIGHADDTLWSARARARVGYDLGNLLPFVAAGVVENESYERTLAPAAGGPGDFFGANRRRTGFTAGAGLDYKFTPPIAASLFGPMVLRIEYVYENLPTRTFVYGPVGAPNVVSQKQDSHFLRLGLISTFGDARVSPSYAGQVAAAGPGTVLWNGAYGGVIGGYGSTRVRTTNGVGSGSLTADGGMGGIYTGRNFQFGHVVVGLEGSTMIADWTGTGSEAFIARARYRNYIQADIRGRLGYAFGAFLPFIAGGVSFGRSEQADLTTGSQRGRVPTEAYTVGAGLDYRISDRFSVRGEYLYERTIKNVSVDLNNLVNSQSRRADMVRVGVAYHFQ